MWQWQSDSGPDLQLEFLGDGMGEFFDWSTEQQAQRLPCVICCGDFLEVNIKLCGFRL